MGMQHWPQLTRVAGHHTQLLCLSPSEGHFSFPQTSLRTQMLTQGRC